jgi:hypothetical protein
MSGSAVPPAHLSGQAVWDGAASTGCLWLCVGAALIAANDPAAPAITISTASPAGSLPNVFAPASVPSVFTVRGGYPSVYGATKWSIFTFNNAPASPIGRFMAVEFMTDAPKLAIGLGVTGQSYRIMVDGRYVQMSSILPSGSDTYVTLDFTATTRRKVRRITIESGRGSGLNFTGVWVTSLDDIRAVPVQDDVRAAFVSDSLMAGSGYGTFLPGLGLTQRLAKMLGWSDPWGFVEGGRGYINNIGGTRYTFGECVPEALTRNPDIWMFMGSTNDTAVGSAAITAAALAAYRAIRDGGSTAPIVVLGVWPIDDGLSGATSKTAYIEAAVQAAVTAFADPLGKTFFLPIRGAAPLPWVTGSWNNAANAQSANAPIAIAGDNVHPGELGIGHLAGQIDRVVRSNVLPFLR